MRGHEIHQGQNVIGVGQRPGELPQRQTTYPPMIELQELAVDLHALRFVQRERLALREGQLLQPFETRLGPAGVLSIGTAGGLHLQQAHFDPHLEHFPTVAGAHQPRGNDPRLE